MLNNSYQRLTFSLTCHRGVNSTESIARELDAPQNQESAELTCIVCKTKISQVLPACKAFILPAGLSNYALRTVQCYSIEEVKNTSKQSNFLVRNLRQVVWYIGEELSAIVGGACRHLRRCKF